MDLWIVGIYITTLHPPKASQKLLGPSSRVDIKDFLQTHWLNALPEHWVNGFAKNPYYLKDGSQLYQKFFSIFLFP